MRSELDEITKEGQELVEEIAAFERELEETTTDEFMSDVSKHERERLLIAGSVAYLLAIGSNVSKIELLGIHLDAGIAWILPAAFIAIVIYYSITFSAISNNDRRRQEGKIAKATADLSARRQAALSLFFEGMKEFQGIKDKNDEYFEITTKQAEDIDRLKAEEFKGTNDEVRVRRQRIADLLRAKEQEDKKFEIRKEAAQIRAATHDVVSKELNRTDEVWKRAVKQWRTLANLFFLVPLLYSDAALIPLAAKTAALVEHAFVTSPPP